MKHRMIHLLLLLIVCAIVFGFKAGEYDFLGTARRSPPRRSQPRNGSIRQLAGASSQRPIPLSPKPPLYYWAAAAMFEFTGRFDELNARIPSVIAGTLGVFVTYFWASAMFSVQVGFFAGIILATSFLYGGMGAYSRRG